MAEQVHHFTIANDDLAADLLPSFVAAWADSGITSRYLAVRGGPAHELAIYRRSIEDSKAWDHIRTVPFALPDYRTGSVSGTVQGVPVNLQWSDYPIFPHMRGAVLVESKGSGGSKRRTYVGPISPMGTKLEAGIDQPIISLPGGFWQGSLGFVVGPGRDGDFPMDPQVDQVDVWREDIAGLARDHVFNLGRDIDGADQVVVSWKRATIEPVVACRASYVRAELRSRGSASTFTDPKTAGGGSTGGGGSW